MAHWHQQQQHRQKSMEQQSRRNVGSTSSYSQDGHFSLIKADMSVIKIGESNAGDEYNDVYWLWNSTVMYFCTLLSGWKQSSTCAIWNWILRSWILSENTRQWPILRKTWCVFEINTLARIEPRVIREWMNDGKYTHHSALSATR